MDEISRIFLGKHASPKEKIKLMGQIVVSSMSSIPEKSDEEIRMEVMSRFERLGLKNRARSVAYYEEEVSSAGLQSIIYFLYRLSLTLEDGHILNPPRIPSFSSFSSYSSHINVLPIGKREYKSSTSSPDDGCVGSGRDDCSSFQTRFPSGHLTTEYFTFLKTRTRANPMQRECIEASINCISSSICDAIMGKSTYLFRVQDGLVTTVSPLVISTQSISQTRSFLTPIILFINELLLAEKCVEELISTSRGDLPSQLSHIVLQYLNKIRVESLLLLYTRPFPSPKLIKKNIETIIEKGDQFIALSRQLMKLRNSSCAECLDVLVSDLSNEERDEFANPIVEILRFALMKTLEDAESFMLSGEISQLGLIIESENGSTLNEPYRGGRNEGEKWRKNYGIRVRHAKSIDKTTGDEIMAEGKLGLMRLRDPSLAEEYNGMKWKECKDERNEERKRITMRIERGVTLRDIKEIFRDSIKWVRTCGDRSIFLSKQIYLVANSLEIVWQVFLLGDRVTRVPHFDGSVVERFQSMRDAMSAFPHQHLLSVTYASKRKTSRSTSYIQLKVSGALSIVVSSSNISIYTETHKLLSKLSQVYHQISQAYLCLPPLGKGCDLIKRGLHKALAEITHWLGKLCGHFCTQVHEVVWKQTNKEVLSSLPSFDVLFSVHRKALKQLATTFFLQTSAANLSHALHSSIDASSEFAHNLEIEEWEKAAEKYTDFIEAAQMFTHGLMVDDDPLRLRSTLLFIIDPNHKFRA